MFVKRVVLGSFFILLFLVCFGIAQEKLGPLTLEQIESVLADLPPARVATIIRDRGVDFEVTEEIRERLRRAGADALVMQAVERAAVEYPKRKLEEQRKKLEEERRKIVEEKSRLEETRLKEEERQRLEQERKQLDQEKQTLTEEKLKVKTETEKLEEERKRSPQIKPDSGKEPPSRPMLVPLAP